MTESPRVTEAENSWLTDNLLQLRLNNGFHFSNDWEGALEVRSRLFGGETFRRFPNFPDLLEWNPNRLDLSKVMFHDDFWIWQNEADRLWIEKRFESVEVRLGRQRINWGQNFVWNPNDLFNAYSYLDFDHEEKPGSDALRVTWHTGSLSQIEFAHKWAANSEKNVSALLWKFNRSRFDFQFLAGTFESEPVFGAGFSGQIGWAGVRGETTCFEGLWVSALSADYTFSNSFYVHLEALHNEPSEEAVPDTMAQSEVLFSPMISPKRLALARFSAFLELAFDVTPLLRADLSGIVSGSDHSFFWSPSLTYSLETNWDLKIFSQFFQGDSDSEWGRGASLVGVQMKRSF